ncbi:uncharacterized protein LAESUDRAFT_624797, partial [Laetiporus sulphureus 93-53]
APQDVLSFSEAVNNEVQTSHTLGPNVRRDPYRVPIIRLQLSRSLPKAFPEMRDEPLAVFGD